jgi:type II secretory pathway component PulJ
MLILGSSVLLFALISVIVWMFTKQITEPIRRLTELTEKLKQATDVEAKKVVINTV